MADADLDVTHANLDGAVNSVTVTGPGVNVIILRGSLTVAEACTHLASVVPNCRRGATLRVQPPSPARPVD